MNADLPHPSAGPNPASPAHAVAPGKADIHTDDDDTPWMGYESAHPWTWGSEPASLSLAPTGGG